MVHRRSSEWIPGGAIAAAIEARRVVGSLVYFATEIAEPGVVRHIEGDRMLIGEPDGTRSARSQAIAEALISAGLRCPVTTHIREEIWVKILGNVAFNPISALTGATLAAWLPTPMYPRWSAPSWARPKRCHAAWE